MNMIVVARDAVKNLNTVSDNYFFNNRISTLATIPYFANSDQQEFPIIAECLTISDNCGTGGSRGALL